MEKIDHWPMLEGKKWNETRWDWSESILKFRETINKREDDIFDDNRKKVKREDMVMTTFLKI